MNELKNNVSSKSNINTLAYRLISAVIAIACVVAFFLPYTLFASLPDRLIYAEKKLFQLFELLPDAPYKAFGFLPLFTNPKSTLGFAGGIVTYVIVIALVVAFVCSIVAMICGKKAERFTFLATSFFTWGAALYMIAVVSITCYHPMAIVFDKSAIILASIGTLAYVALIFVKCGKKLCLINSVRFLLTLAFTVTLLLAVTMNFDLVSSFINEKKLYKIGLIIAIALTLVNVIFASLRAFKEKAFSFDFINAVAEVVISVAIIILSVTSSVKDKDLLTYGGISAGIAVILFILTFVSVKIEQRRALLKASEEKTCEKTACATATDEKDYFDGKQIDKFIETLNVTERNQFASIYLLKSPDVMPEIPAYQIGENNRNFFEMAFITLGEYRDNIPDGLLSKMYDYICEEYPQAEVPQL